MEYFTNALKQYADFEGRSRRKEYWMFILFYLIFYVVLSVIDSLIGVPVLSTVFSLALLVPSVSIAARRLHDTGRSGWWQLLVLIPILGALVLLFFLVQDSQDENEYGANPKLA
jgi:uncharacterized membrane protein YhaH (DUF805 family)